MPSAENKDVEFRVDLEYAESKLNQSRINKLKVAI